MYVFHLNVPWIIDETEYNCSGRTLSEWKSGGSVNEVQGIYYAVTGIFFVALYIVCLIGMYRGKLLKTPCYRLMFFNGFIDIMDLFASSLIPAYFHLTGGVFCSSVAFGYFSGYFSWCVWSGASFNCTVLALNRVVEMIPSAKFLRFLFEGQAIRIWMALSVLYMVVLPFITRAHPFNSVISTYIPSPMITDDPAEEAAHFATLLVTVHNVTIVVVMICLYSLLCIYVVSMRRYAKGIHYKIQIQLLIQTLLICSTIAVTSLLYVFSGFLPFSRGLVIGGNVLWQLSHGLHGIIYFCFNGSIRNEVLGIFGRNAKVHSIITVTAITDARRFLTTNGVNARKVRANLSDSTA